MDAIQLFRFQRTKITGRELKGRGKTRVGCVQKVVEWFDFQGEARDVAFFKYGRPGFSGLYGPLLPGKMPGNGGWLLEISSFWYFGRWVAGGQAGATCIALNACW